MDPRAHEYDFLSPKLERSLVIGVGKHAVQSVLPLVQNVVKRAYRQYVQSSALQRFYGALAMIVYIVRMQEDPLSHSIVYSVEIGLEVLVGERVCES